MSDDRRIYPMGYPVGPADPPFPLRCCLNAFLASGLMWFGIFLVLRWVL